MAISLAIRQMPPLESVLNMEFNYVRTDDKTVNKVGREGE